MNGEWREVRCPDGVVRPFYFCFADNSLRDSKGHPPSWYIRKARVSAADLQAADEIERAREEARAIRDAARRNRFGK